MKIKRYVPMSGNTQERDCKRTGDFYVILFQWRTGWQVEVRHKTESLEFPERNGLVSEYFYDIESPDPEALARDMYDHIEKHIFLALAIAE